MEKKEPTALDYIAGYPTTGWSGMEKATREKAEALATLVQDFKFYSIQKRGRNRLAKAWLLILHELTYFLKLVSGGARRPDSIIIRSSFLVPVFIASKLFNIRLFIEVHADSYEEATLVSHSRLAQAILRTSSRWTRFFLRRADGLIFNHPLLQEHFKAAYNIQTPSIYAYNGARPLTDEHLITTKRARQLLGLNLDRRYLVFSGSVSPWHGVDYLLDMFPTINISGLDLLIVGGSAPAGTDTYENQKLSNGNQITFTGRVNTEVATLYTLAADACLMPVKSIRVSPGSPLKLYEYALAGKPIITQENTPGYSDVVIENSLGTTCDFTNAKSAGSTVARFLSELDPEQYTSNNREKAATSLSWRSTLSKWMDFINSYL